MEFTFWYLAVGALLLLMALTGSVVKRAPMTSAMFYMLAGVALGPVGAGLLRVDAVANAHLLERFTEVAVIVSLFSAGLKLRLPLRDRRWRPAVRLASIGMVITVASIAAVAVLGLGLSLAAAILLGAVLAPTDPVLASDVQVDHAHDREEVRFTLTGEAGLNDGTAFPFVMLALGLLGLHDHRDSIWRWLAIDFGWAITAGLAVGTIWGTLIGRLVLYLRREHREALGLDDFLGLGLIALSYGTALLVHSYGFLAVFAAGLALRRIERQHSADAPPEDVQKAGESDEDAATDAHRGPAYMAQAVLRFNEQLERLGEVAVVVVVGAALAYVTPSAAAVWFCASLFIVIRPAATMLSLAGTRMAWSGRAFIAWFGVRGIGSIYYLAFALTHGLQGADARTITDVTLIAIAASIIAHGVSVTPMMNLYERRRGRDPR